MSLTCDQNALDCFFGHACTKQHSGLMIRIFLHRAKDQGAFWNISFEPQLIKAPNLTN